MPKPVSLLFFGSLRDIMGSKHFEITIDETMNTQEFLNTLKTKFQQFIRVYELLMDKNQKPPIIIMVNGRPLEKAATFELNPGDEIAFLPPVGGG